MHAFLKRTLPLGPLCGAVLLASSVSPARAQATAGSVATFAADWSFTIEGEPAQGEQLEIRYDVSRLTACRDTRYGLPAWSILARYRFASGQSGYVPVTSGVGTLDLTGSGELEIWFENQGYSGCRAYDSSFGQNYRIFVSDNPNAPGWVGNGAYIIDRLTCGGGPCDSSRRPLYQTFTYGSSARQRATIQSVYFDVWQPGVTDFDNPDLWRELDVQVHYRARRDGEFTSEFVDFFERVGNDARYEFKIARFDPFTDLTVVVDPADCPDADILTSGDGITIGADVEYYFTINGVVFRNAQSQRNFFGRFESERAPFEVCVEDGR